MKGYVYFVGMRNNESLVKIGHTKRDVQARINSMQTSTPFKLVLLYKVKSNDCLWLEKKLHDHFIRQRYRGEWFKINHNEVISQYRNFVKLYGRPDLNVIPNLNTKIKKEKRDISIELDFIKNTFILPKGSEKNTIRLHYSKILILHPNTYTGCVQNTILALKHLGFKSRYNIYKVILKPNLKFQNQYASDFYNTFVN